MKEIQFRANGLVWKNITEKCLIMDDKKLNEKERGNLGLLIWSNKRNSCW